MSGRHAPLRVWLGGLLLVLSSLACTLSSETGVSTRTSESAPLVLLLAPVNNSTFAEGATVELHALAQDLQGRVARMEFRVDDVPLPDSPELVQLSQQTVSARAQWTAQEQRKHVLTVEAFHAEGLSLGFRDIVIEVVAAPDAGIAPGAVARPALPDEAATFTPAATAATSTPQFDIGILSGPLARVQVAELNVRQGPGTQYPSVGTLSAGDLVEIVGRNADGSWWAIAFRGGSAWVFADLVTPEEDVSEVPLVAPPP